MCIESKIKKMRSPPKKMRKEIIKIFEIIELTSGKKSGI